MISQHTIQQFNAGDEKAFREIYDYWFGYAFRLINKRYGWLSRDYRDEILSHTFMQVWAYRDTLLTNEKTKAFVSITALNKSRNVIKNMEYRIRVLVEYAESGLMPEEGFEEEPIPKNPNQAIIDKIKKHLKKLPKKRRKIIQMYYFKGYQLGEIADKTGTTMQTVKNLKTLAINQLKKAIL